MDLYIALHKFNKAMEIKETQKGFLIIEVVISVFIVGVMLLVYAAASNTMALNRTAKNQQLAYRIANNEMERLRSLSYASLPASGTFTDTLLSTLPSSTAIRTVADYNASTKQVTTVVTWRDPGSSVTRNVTLTTLINQYGLGQ